MKITYYGHSCFSVITEGIQLLFDPFISGNPLANNIDINSISADYIFVSHGHFDHIMDVTAIANRTGALVVCVWELYEYFKKQGLQNLQPLNPGGNLNLEFGNVRSVIAQHSSSFVDGSYAGLACGFVVSTRSGNFYYSGDTALTYDMALIPQWQTIDFAVLPIGDVLTMGADDAIKAAEMIQTKKVIGVHYDTFEAIEIDKEEVNKLFTKAEIKLYLPDIGTTIIF